MSHRYFEKSDHAAVYAKFRPPPPESLVSCIMEYLSNAYDGPMEAAVDVGCGSGQSTHVLVPHFTSVTGLDISPAQVAEAVKLNKTPRVSFKVSGAESMPVPDSSQQLVTAGQACHWFDLPKFFKEVDRILVPGGVVALYSYMFPRIVHPHLAERLTALVDELALEALAEYWGKNIKDVCEAYQDPKFTIPFPDYCRDATNSMEIDVSLAELILFFTTWSGFNTYKEKNGAAAAQKLLDDFQEKFMTILGVSTPPEDTPLCISFHFQLIMGRKPCV